MVPQDGSIAGSARVRILFLLPSFYGGGAERVVTTLLRHLNRDAFELHLAAMRVEGEFLRDVPQDVKLHNLRSSRARYAIASLVRLIRKLRPTTVLSTVDNANLILALMRPLIPRETRVVIREASVVRDALRDEQRNPRLWEWLYRHLYKQADKIVCLSDSMVNDMHSHFALPRERLLRIYNPVDIERVRALAEERGNPYSGEGPFLVAAGRLCRAKGFDVLVNAMPIVLQHFPQAKLFVLGQGPLHEPLLRETRLLGLVEAIRWIGFQHNPWPFFKYANVFVIPSRHEASSNAMLEAMSLGTPVVATDCPGGIRELRAGNERVHLIASEDPRALAEGIITACRRPQTSAKELPSSLSSFAVARIAAQYSAVLSGT